MIRIEKKEGNTSVQDLIYTPLPSVKSRAAYILLKIRLLVQDEERCEGGKKKRMHDWLLFRELWLKWKLEEEGDLVCVECGKEHLEIGGRSWKELKKNEKNKDLATIDHIYPLGKGGERYDMDNLQVMCKKCNQKKADKVPERLNIKKSREVEAG